MSEAGWNWIWRAPQYIIHNRHKEPALIKLHNRTGVPLQFPGKEPAVGRFIGNSDYAVSGQPNAPCLHSIHLGYMIGPDGVRIALARIHLFLQLHPSPTYLATVGIIRPDAVAKIASAEWHLPVFGEIGDPMSPPLPKWLATRIYSGGRPLEDTVVYKEFKERGFAP